MFFVIGINEKREEIDCSQVMICDLCGEYGRYQVFLTCTILYLFFLPVFRWNYHYYVETSCCHALYELNNEAAKAILRKEKTEIRPEDLTLLNGRQNRSFKKCICCGYETGEDFDFCPKCGNRF